MSRSRPPTNAPPGKIFVGGSIPWFVIRIEITAEELKPDDITSLLGVSPTDTQEKGKLRVLPNGKTTRIGRFGRWSLALQVEEADDMDVDEAAKYLLQKVPMDEAIWRAICAQATVRLSIGVSLETFNQGLSLDADLVHLLAACGMQLDIDIYLGEAEWGDDEISHTSKDSTAKPN